MLAGRTVVVGITGGVAVHYLPELIGQIALSSLGSCVCRYDASRRKIYLTAHGRGCHGFACGYRYLCRCRERPTGPHPPGATG